MTVRLTNMCIFTICC